MVDDQVVVDEPSIVAMNRRTNETIAVGHRAMQMHEKTHENIKTVRPLKDEEIAWKEQGTREYQELARRSLATMEQVEALTAPEPDRKRLDLSTVQPLYKTKR